MGQEAHLVLLATIISCTPSEVKLVAGDVGRWPSPHAVSTPVTGVPIICQMAVAPAPQAVCHNFCRTNYYGWHAHESPECTRAPPASPGRCVPPALGLHPEPL